MSALRILDRDDLLRFIAGKQLRLGEAEAVVRPILDDVRSRGQIGEQARNLGSMASDQYRKASESASGWAEKGREMVNQARDAVSLAPVEEGRRENIRLLFAGRMGTTRLIDNILVRVEE